MVGSNFHKTPVKDGSSLRDANGIKLYAEGQVVSQKRRRTGRDGTGLKPRLPLRHVAGRLLGP